MDFNKVLEIANQLQNHGMMTMTAITYYPINDSWVIYFSDDIGSTYVNLITNNIPILLRQFKKNYEASPEEEA